MLFVTLLTIYLASCVLCQTSIKNKLVTRLINAETHILRIDTEITAEFLGKHDSYKYVYVIDKILQNKLAIIIAKSATGEKLKVESVPSENGYMAFRIDIPMPVSGVKTKFTVSSVYTKSLVPKPSEITQADKQYISFSINAYYLSTYETEKQESTVTLSSGEILLYNESPNPVTKMNSKIKYGPYENRQKFSEHSISFNYENGTPFLAVTKLTRIIEVSHWGNIAVEEHIDILHYGAKLRGPFSRLDYQRGIGHHASVSTIKTLLPSSARDIYYRDEIGNISTSNVKDLFDSVELELQPRFPLFGGWKTYYIVGYNLPAHECLFKKDDKFALRMRFVDHLYDDQVIDEINLKIILPETVSNVKFVSPFSSEILPLEVTKTYLDTTGRIVVLAKKQNVVEEHIQDFTVYYHFNHLNMIREPIMLISAFMILFTVIMIYVRLDFSLTKDKSTEIQDQVQAVVDLIITSHNKRSAIYQTYEDVLNSYKTNKDPTLFNNEFRKVDNEHKTVTQQISEHQNKLREFWNEGAEKLQELQRLDQLYRELLQKSVNCTERVLSKKISKPQYQTADAELSSEKVGIIEKMNTILQAL